MKHVILLLTVILLFSSKGITQQNDRKGFTAVNLGSSFPTGNFKSTNYRNAESGYATNGLVIDFTIGHHIRKNFGVTAMFRSQVNGVNDDAFANDIENNFHANNPGRTISVNIESSSYALGGIMAGIYGDFPIVKELIFEPRFLIGYSAETLPTRKIETYESGTKLSTFIREESYTMSFSYLIGAGVKYDVSKKIGIMFNIDYYSAYAEWGNVKEIGIGHISGTTTYFIDDYIQKFSTLNISGGLGFKF